MLKTYDFVLSELQQDIAALSERAHYHQLNSDFTDVQNGQLLAIRMKLNDLLFLDAPPNQ